MCWRWSAQWAPPAHSTSIRRAFIGRCCRRRSTSRSSYYKKWFLGLEDLLVDKGFIAAEDVAAGHAVQPPKTLKRGKFALDDVERVMVRGKFGRPAPANPRIQTG